MKTNRRFGYVTASPCDFVIHTRRGRILHSGLGLSVFCLPWWDRCCVIPATANNISFLADQITQENQGVQIEGFAIWKVREPDKTYLHFDFSRADDPIARISAYLKDVVESAIRHQVANMTIEDVLRKRGSIIHRLKEELSYITGQWGLVMDTIEIKNVRIMSAQLFANMQARYRDAIRLESETSALRVEKEIAEQRFLQKEQLALREQEIHRNELQRKAELERLGLEERKRIKLQEMEQELAVAEQAEANQRVRAASQLETLETERPLQTARLALQAEAKAHEAKMGHLDAGLTRERIEAGNAENGQHLLYRKLPEIAAALKVHELNVGHDTLAQLAAAVTRFLESRKVS